jgi:hypothetical protein
MWAELMFCDVRQRTSLFRKRGYGADDRALTRFDCGAIRKLISFHVRLTVALDRAGKASTSDELGRQVCPSNFPVPRGAQRSQSPPFSFKAPAEAVWAPGRGLAGELGRGGRVAGIVNYIPSRGAGQETLAGISPRTQRGFSTRTRKSRPVPSCL